MSIILYCHFKEGWTLPWSVFPAINASLNLLSFLFLILGYRYIRRRDKRNHKICMITAFGLSMIFLISYLTYHAHAGTTRFTGQGWIRTVYFGILVTHTILAVLVTPAAIYILHLALRGDFQRHRRIAPVILPFWLYVSATGVIIYLMLYRPFG